MAQSPINRPIWSHCPWRSLHFNSISFFCCSWGQQHFTPDNSHGYTHTYTRHLTHSYTHNHTHMHIHTHIHLYPSRNQKMKQKNVSRWRHTFKESTFCGADEKLFFFDSLYHFEMALNSFLLLNLFQRSLGQPVWPNFWIKSLPNFVQIFPKIKRSGFDLNTDNFSKQPKK